MSEKDGPEIVVEASATTSQGKDVIMKKVTELEGYYATNDFESFCFDKHRGPYEHHRALESTEEFLRWFNLTLEEEEKLLAEGKELPTYDPDQCRVYTSDLLPKRHRHQKGNWKITVEFTPVED